MSTFQNVVIVVSLALFAVGVHDLQLWLERWDHGAAFQRLIAGHAAVNMMGAREAACPAALHGASIARRGVSDRSLPRPVRTTFDADAHTRGCTPPPSVVCALWPTACRPMTLDAYQGNYHRGWPASSARTTHPRRDQPWEKRCTPHSR